MLMTDYTYTSRDWLVVCGAAMLMLSWWLSFRIVRDREEVAGFAQQRIQ